MEYPGQVIENPISGERITFRRTAAETNGELLAFDLELQPDGAVPGKHVHPSQEERFTVVSGRMKFKKGLRTVIAEAGDVVVVPPGTPHKFENAGDRVAHVSGRGPAGAQDGAAAPHRRQARRAGPHHEERHAEARLRPRPLHARVPRARSRARSRRHGSSRPRWRRWRASPAAADAGRSSPSPSPREAPSRAPADRQPAVGGMFWLWRNRFSGSHCVLERLQPRELLGPERRLDPARALVADEVEVGAPGRPRLHRAAISRV